MENQQEQQTVVPYLIIPEAHKFFDFVQKVFNGEEKFRFMNDDQSLMHGEVNIGGSTIMFGDSGEQWQSQPAGLFINVENADETFQKALDNGATVIMGLEDKDYGRTGGVKDPFGNTWWITARKKL
jgi:PhnB protein